MKYIVLDTNCLIACIGFSSAYRLVWNSFINSKFVDCAIIANADYIVSNDGHFDVLKNIDFPKVNVISSKDFLRHLELGVR